MAACAGLCSACGLSLGAALCVSAMLPLAASAVYASNMTIGGYYIIHLIFGFWGVSLWLRAARRQRKRDKAAFALLCLVEGLCSVRYVLASSARWWRWRGLTGCFPPESARAATRTRGS